jgi:hypothetical protein
LASHQAQHNAVENKRPDTRREYSSGDCTFNIICDQTNAPPGTDSSTVSARSADDCANQCYASAECNTLSFDGHTNTCTLFDITLSSNPSDNPGDAYGIIEASC